MHRMARTGVAEVWAASVALGLLCCTDAHAAEIRGELNLGHFAGDTNSSWTQAGLGKARIEDSAAVGRLALRVDTQLLADFVASVVVDVDSESVPSLVVQEAWLGWNPVPISPWRTRVKAGAFFPVTSLEVGYDSVDWSAVRTVSSSAINSWIGEEIRIKGIEFALLRRGEFVSSSHTFGVTLGAFEGNDPAGTQLAWQGWNLGNRSTGLSQRTKLPDLPTFRPDGAIPIQTRNAHVLREIDGRVGYYGAVNYSYLDRLDLSAMHYDNCGDPTQIAQGQYSWHTRFDHVSARLNLPGNWEFLAQALRGQTVMGDNAVNMDFSAWFLLGSYRLGRGLVTLRHDRFWNTDGDRFPEDPNGESGNAWTLAYRYPLRRSVHFIAETMRIDSNRAARVLIGEPTHQVEGSVEIAIRWSF
jgi:hypothetical protein